MSATPPEANVQYSRGPEGSSRESGAPPDGTGPVLAGILAGGFLGALLLLVAEFTVLFEVHVASTTVPLKSVTAGSHHSYALVPIALVAAALAFGVWRAASRPALLAIGVMGVIALLITLLGDLPDAHAKGLVGSSATHFVDASSSPKAGF